MKKPELKHVPLSEIVVKPQVRTIFDEEPMNELVDSVREKGVLQPILLNNISGRLELVCGERRFRASKAVMVAIKDRNTIPATVYDNLTPDQVLELQIIENLQRKDVHPVEEAIAFKRMVDMNKFDVTEIAKRVSRSAAYVGARLKLSDLIPEFQKAFYKDRMTLVTALKICKISNADQKALWKEDFEGEEREIKVDSYTLKAYMNDLLQAPFDTKNKELVKGMGACVGCQFNTASNSLFPDESGRSVCMNSVCFRNKCDTSYKIKLKEALEDPETFLITNSYGTMEKEAKSFADKGHTVYKYYDIQTVEMPEPVDREEFEQDLEDEAFDSKKEMEDAYSRAMKDFDKEMGDYNKDIASGKYKRGFMIDGDKKGHTIYMIPKKKSSSSSSSGAAVAGSAKAAQEKIKEGKASEADLKAEVDRLNKNEKRSKELDDERIGAAVYELFSKNKDLVANTKPLNNPERLAVFMMLVSFAGYDAIKFCRKVLPEIGNYDHYGPSKAKFYKQVKALPEAKFEKLFSGFSRLLMVPKFKQSNSTSYVDNADTAVMFDVALTYDKAGVDKIVLDQMDVRANREVRVTKALNSVKEKMKDLKKPAVKPKGKGLAALLPDAKKVAAKTAKKK